MAELNQKVYDKAIRLLGIRQHTTGELFRKLADKGFKSQDIVPVLKLLEGQRFLDDQRFAEIFVDNLKRYKDWGYYGIKAKLLARRVPSDIAAQALAEFLTLEDEITVAKKFLAKIKKQDQAIPFEKIMQKFSSKGFRTDASRQALHGS